MVYTGPQVHSWHEAIDWGAVAGAGHTFAWVPATAGIATVEPRFEGHWDAMAAAGLVRGAVHTLSPHYVGRGEARHFVDVVGDPAGALTAVAVQPDGPRLSDRMPGIDQVGDFAAEFARLTDGHPLIIRTRWSWWARRDPRGWGRQISPHLWNADGAWARRSGRGCSWPTYGGWTTPTIWGAHSVRCPGVAGLCPMTMFTGDLEALTVLLGLADGERPAGPGERLISWVRRRWRRGTPARP